MCELQTMSVTQIHNLIHAALLVARNVIWLHTRARNIYTFAVLFLRILFFLPILFHIIAGEERSMPKYCVLWKSSFLSRGVLFDCGWANWSCMSRSFKGDMLVCMVSAVKLIPWNLSWCFASSVCFTCDLAHFKKIFPGFARDWCHYPCER